MSSVKLVGSVVWKIPDVIVLKKIFLVIIQVTETLLAENQWSHREC